MLQRKRLKLWMKKALEAKGLNPNSYHYTKNLPSELHLIHKETQEQLVLEYREAV